jgi:hypothetical protein
VALSILARPPSLAAITTYLPGPHSSSCSRGSCPRRRLTETLANKVPIYCDNHVTRNRNAFNSANSFPLQAVSKSSNSAYPNTSEVKFWRMPSSGLALCGFTTNLCFGATCRLHLQGRRNNARVIIIISSTLKMEATRSSETLSYNKPRRRHIPEDGSSHTHCREKLISYKVKVLSVLYHKAFGEEEVFAELHVFLTSALGRINDQLHASATLPWENCPPPKRQGSGPQRRSGLFPFYFNVYYTLTN